MFCLSDKKFFVYIYYYMVIYVWQWWWARKVTNIFWSRMLWMFLICLKCCCLTFLRPQWTENLPSFLDAFMLISYPSRVLSVQIAELTTSRHKHEVSIIARYKCSMGNVEIHVRAVVHDLQLHIKNYCKTFAVFMEWSICFYGFFTLFVLFVSLGFGVISV